MSGDLSECRLCPRRCGVDRSQGRIGVCAVPEMVYVARAALHFWEEPCISGENGSGTVFFSGCPLRCVYCQNFELARAKRGKPVTVEALSRLFLKLQEEGANNINLVTPTQYTLAIIPAVRLAKDEGLHLPIVYNCGGYESVETLRLLEGTVDIYLTDLKYLDEYASKRYSGAADYPAVAKDAIYEMVRQCKETVFECDGMMQKGVIVRHLLLPGRVREAKQVVRYLYSTYGNAIWMSLLNQYTPFGRVKERFPELARGVTKREYDTLVDYAIELGVTNAFIQEGATAKESFIPGFSGEGVRS